MYRNTLVLNLFRLFVAVSLFSAAFLFAKPASAETGVPNPAAEQYLLNELRATGIVDLQWDFAEEDRGISGAVIERALKDPEVLSKPLIYIASVTVTDDLWARDVIIPANVVFAEAEFAGLVNFASTQLQSVEIYNSKFLGDVDFSDSSFSRQLYLIGNDFGGTVYFGTSVIEGYANITGNTFQESLTFLRATLNGNVDLRDNTINESLNFYGAHVAGELLLDGSKVLGTQAMSGTTYPTEFWNTTVDGLASFNNVEFEGEAYFFGSHFSKLDMYGTVFKSFVGFGETIVDQIADFRSVTFMDEANFQNFNAGTDANFQGAVFNGVAVFENAFVGRDGNFQDTTFNDLANFYYFTAERFVDFSGATFNQALQFYYTIVAYPYFENVTFNGPVTFEGAQVSQDFEIINSTYNYEEEPLPFTLAHVEGVVRFKGITAPAGLQLSDSHFGGLTITTSDNPKIQLIDLTETDIENDLTIENADITDFLATGMSVGGSTTLYQVVIANQLDLRNADIGFLKVDDKFTPPTDPKAFNLRGMTYSDIDLGDQGLTDETWKGLLKFINDSAYSPQAYQALAQFLTDKGHSDWAAEVELAQKRRERNDVLSPLSGAWIWSWFLDIFSGYGHRPALAFIWSALVVASGAFVFRRKEDMLPVEQDDAKVEYNPIWYSFALFLPYIDLGIASKWEPNPERRWARNYKYVHMMLGWILAPIALLTFGGIIG